MKFQSNNLLENLSGYEIKMLTAQVEETLQPRFKNEKKRGFSAAQLWDIYRRRKNTFSRRAY
jgi:hypothetical protein